MNENCHFQVNVDGLWQCAQCGWIYPRKRDKPPFRNCPAAQQPHLSELATRPGWQLHRLLKRWTREDIEPGCKCRERIAEMDRRGTQWCRANVEKIVGWLYEEIERRQKIDNPSRAIRLAGRDLPGQRLVMRQMVLRAIKRAEQASRKAAKTQRNFEIAKQK